MAGIYVHIPFCRRACHYCNFHFSTSFRLKDDLLDALRREMAVRSVEGKGLPVETVYFGGGTPSVLGVAELRSLLDVLRAHYDIRPEAEVTLEANPDDLTPTYLDELKSAGITRLSIGIQSFRDADLQAMNRSHDAAQAREVINLAREAGFTSLNADLIYGIPGLDDEALTEHVDRLVVAGADHISAYALTVEPGTALAHFVRKDPATAPAEEQTVRQFALVQNRLREAGYDHYEISNWALPGCHSRHNTAYWTGTPYLGFGPAAHSFDGAVRSWNVAHNPRYIQGWATGNPEVERETLSPADRYNEFVLTRLRTRWGCALSGIDPAFRDHFLREVRPFLDKDWIGEEGGIYRLTEAGMDFADHIASVLFSTPD